MGLEFKNAHLFFANGAYVKIILNNRKKYEYLKFYPLC